MSNSFITVCHNCIWKNGPDTHHGWEHLDDSRQDLPMEAFLSENTTLVQYEIWYNIFEVKETIASVDLFETTNLQILQEHLHTNKVSATCSDNNWGIQKHQPVIQCERFLQLYSANQRIFLQSISTVNEMGII